MIVDRHHTTAVFIDCDTGRDDALAIWLSLLHGHNVQGIVASYGNTPLPNVIENSARVLSLVNKQDIPIYAGAEKPLEHHSGFRDVVLPRQEASGNGLCDVELPLSNDLNMDNQSLNDFVQKLKLTSKDFGPVDYVITGPATSFSIVCDILGKDIHEYVRSVTMMGGKFDSMWKVVPGADFNLLCDPYALKKVFETGVSMRLVPMDFTWPMSLSLAEIEKLVPATDVAEYSKSLMIAHCKKFAPEPIFRFHDPAVFIAMMHPQFFERDVLDINLNEESDDFARLIDGGSHCIQVYRPDVGYKEGFVTEILDALGFKGA